jgi:hypothetical protein
MHGFRSKLMCMFKPVEVADNNNKVLAYYEICLFPVYYDSVMFYSIGANVIKLFLSVNYRFLS